MTPCERNIFCILTTTESGKDLVLVKCVRTPRCLGCSPLFGGCSGDVDSLFIGVPKVCRGSVFGSQLLCST